MPTCDKCGIEYTFPNLHIKCVKQKDEVNSLYGEILKLPTSDYFELMKRLAEYMQEQQNEINNLKFK